MLADEPISPLKQECLVSGSKSCAAVSETSPPAATVETAATNLLIQSAFLLAFCTDGFAR